METARKLVFQYDDGSFYAWRGESRSYAVEHKTNTVHDADDFSHLMYPEQDADPMGWPDPKGKLIWVSITYELDIEYEPDIVDTE